MREVEFEYDIDNKVFIKMHKVHGVIMRLCREKECNVFDVEYKDRNGKIEEIRCFASDIEESLA